MSQDREIKILFTGPMGAGKTTAISAISDFPAVSTEVDNNDLGMSMKDQTTVALDFGQMTLNDDLVLRLYGTPGQERFNFMWEILSEGALGVIILLDASHPDALRHLDLYTAAFRQACERRIAVIGLGRGESAQAISVEKFRARLATSGFNLPLLSVDVRRRADVALLLEALMAELQTEQELGALP